MFEPLTKVIAYIFTFMILVVGICFGLLFYLGSFSQETNLTYQPIDVIIDNSLMLNEEQKLGKDLFKANCASCHKPTKRSVGPPLAGVSNKHDKEWIYSWVANPQEKITSGDPAAIKIYNEYNQTTMNPFPQLSHKEIDAILSYADSYLK